MKITTILTTLLATFAFTASAVDLSHDFSYGSSVTTGNIVSTSKTISDSQTVTIASDADNGRVGVAPSGIYAVDNSGIIDSNYLYGVKSGGVDNTVTGTSFESSITQSETNSNDAGSFSSVTAFNETTITSGGLSAGEGNRFTVYAQDMTGSSSTKGKTETINFEVNTSTNGGAEVGTEYKYSTSTTDFTSNVNNKVSTTRKNTITDYSFIK